MTIRSRSSGNRISRFIFGMVFAFAGAFCIYSYFNFEITGDAWVALFIGIVFVVIGVGIAGFFKHCILDPRQGFVETGFGVFFPFKQTRHQLEDFQQVSLRHEVRTRSSKNGSTTYDVYPLRLDGRENVELGEWLDFNQGRQKAEAVSKYLHLPLRDSSTGEEVVRQPEDLDESLAERRRDAGESTEKPEQPSGSEIQVSSFGGETTLSLPCEGVNATHIVSFLMVIVFFGFIAFQGFLGQVPVTFVVIGIGVGLGIFAIRAFTPVKVTIDHTTLKVSRGLPFGGSGQIDNRELEELNSNDNKLTAVSDRRRLVIPVYASDEEDVLFVRDIILYHLGR